ncbi:MAG: glycoside hydrolase family 28 protein [Treponema sp.]|nr:glycoside hydrolase family 28 protein [Treponema sp.]
MKSTIPFIKTASTADTITIWWDEPDGIPAAGTEYAVFLNGRPALTTRKTHCTVTGLTARMTYAVTVTSEYGEAKCKATTREHAERIDVSAPPFNACGDGKTLNTAALQAAFDSCGSGQCVYIPRGVFLTGALRMHSGMELYLEEGAVLQGTNDPKDYLPLIHSRFEGIEQDCYASLLNLGELNRTAPYNCRDVLIYGKGTIASGGAELAKAVIRTERVRLSAYLASLGDKIKECEHKDTIPGRMRPRLINMSNCQNVRISGLTLANGASWNMHFIYSDKILTDNCVFKSEGVWNGDGWDPDSSTNCTIFGCKFYTGDDSVAIKSGKNPEGNVINRPTEHIRIFDCSCAYGHGITIGSEISGGINDVRIWDCDMSASMQGIEIKATKKRGGYVRNVQVRNCQLSRLQMHSVGYNDDGVPAEYPPVFEDCSFRNLVITGRMLDHERHWHDCAAIDFRGFDIDSFEARNILVRDVELSYPEGTGAVQTLTVQSCRGVSLENITCR